MLAAGRAEDAWEILRHKPIGIVSPEARFAWDDLRCRALARAGEWDRALAGARELSRRSLWGSLTLLELLASAPKLGWSVGSSRVVLARTALELTSDPVGVSLEPEHRSEALALLKELARRETEWGDDFSSQFRSELLERLASAAAGVAFPASLDSLPAIPDAGSDVQLDLAGRLAVRAYAQAWRAAAAGSQADVLKRAALVITPLVKASKLKEIPDSSRPASWILSRLPKSPPATRLAALLSAVEIDVRLGWGDAAVAVLKSERAASYWDAPTRRSLDIEIARLDRIDVSVAAAPQFGNDDPMEFRLSARGLAGRVILRASPIDLELALRQMPRSIWQQPLSTEDTLRLRVPTTPGGTVVEVNLPAERHPGDRRGLRQLRVRLPRLSPGWYLVAVDEVAQSRGCLVQVGGVAAAAVRVQEDWLVWGGPGGEHRGAATVWVGRDGAQPASPIELNSGGPHRVVAEKGMPLLIRQGGEWSRILIVNDGRIPGASRTVSDPRLDLVPEGRIRPPRSVLASVLDPAGAPLGGTPLCLEVVSSTGEVLLRLARKTNPLGLAGFPTAGLPEGSVLKLALAESRTEASRADWAYPSLKRVDLQKGTQGSTAPTDSLILGSGSSDRLVSPEEATPPSAGWGGEGSFALVRQGSQILRVHPDDLQSRRGGAVRPKLIAPRQLRERDIAYATISAGPESGSEIGWKLAPGSLVAGGSVELTDLSPALGEAQVVSPEGSGLLRARFAVRARQPGIGSLRAVVTRGGESLSLTAQLQVLPHASAVKRLWEGVLANGARINLDGIPPGSRLLVRSTINGRDLGTLTTAGSAPAPSVTERAAASLLRALRQGDAAAQGVLRERLVRLQRKDGGWPSSAAGAAASEGRPTVLAVEALRAAATGAGAAEDRAVSSAASFLEARLGVERGANTRCLLAYGLSLVSPGSKALTTWMARLGDPSALAPAGRALAALALCRLDKRDVALKQFESAESPPADMAVGRWYQDPLEEQARMALAALALNRSPLELQVRRSLVEESARADPLTVSHSAEVALLTLPATPAGVSGAPTPEWKVTLGDREWCPEVGTAVWLGQTPPKGARLELLHTAGEAVWVDVAVLSGSLDDRDEPSARSGFHELSWSAPELGEPAVYLGEGLWLLLVEKPRDIAVGRVIVQVGERRSLPPAAFLQYGSERTGPHGDLTFSRAVLGGSYHVLPAQASGGPNSRPPTEARVVVGVD